MKIVWIILGILILAWFALDTFLIVRRRKKAYVKLCDSLCGKDCLFREENPLESGAYGPGVKDCKNCPLARLK